MNEVQIGIIGLLVLLSLFLMGMEISFALILVGFLGFSSVVSLQAGLDYLARDMFDGFASYSFTVVPLFVLMGQIAYSAGIAKRLYSTAYKFMGHIPGGLAMATVAGASAFKAICGSSTATAATFAGIAIPEMDKYNYRRKLSTGVVASVGALGVLIPPSVILVVIGIITEQSIGKLFLAGVIPSVIIAVFFVIIVYGWCRINPTLGPRGEKSTWSARVKSLPEVVWVLLIFLIVLGGLMMGFFTPTEGGSIGAFALILLSVTRRDIDLKAYITSLRDSVRTGCWILVLVAGSAFFGHFLTVTKIPMLASDWVVSLPLNRYVIIVIIAFVYQIGGSFIEDLAFLMIATPIFLPAVIKLGFDPIWFCIILAINLGIGVVLPPMAICVFVVKKITNERFSVIYSGVYPFLISLIACGALLFLFPQIATFLPNLLMK